MKKHANIPVFIPHEGCPNACVFCNQCVITGEHEKADRDIRPEIDAALESVSLPASDIQIAFFGGSFTGIDRSLMVRLLDDAYAYVRAGKVDSIRLSTRPDYISAEILDILKSHGVKSVELGIQSMDEKVLALAKRGHTVSDSTRACALIKAYGFELVGQMMLGLPGSTGKSEAATAKALAALHCDAARIYPTVVFENTELCRMTKDGAYLPLTVEEAVTRGAAVLEALIEGGVKPIRIGLQATEALSVGSEVYAGANHSALGEKIEGEYYRRLLRKETEKLCTSRADKPETLTVLCAPGEESKVSGQNKTNRLWLAETLFDTQEIHRIKIRPQSGILPYTVVIRPF